MRTFSRPRLAAGSVVILTWQFVILLWFLIGQGYDRAVAVWVAWGSSVLIPVLAFLLLTGVGEAASRLSRFRTALTRSVLLAVVCVWLPVWVMVALPLRSPFAELWWALAVSTLGSAVWVIRWQALRGLTQRTLFVAILVAGILGWRALLFSFF